MENALKERIQTFLKTKKITRKISKIYVESGKEYNWKVLKMYRVELEGSNLDYAVSEGRNNIPGLTLEYAI